MQIMAARHTFWMSHSPCCALSSAVSCSDQASYGMPAKNVSQHALKPWHLSKKVWCSAGALIYPQTLYQLQKRAKQTCSRFSRDSRDSSVALGNDEVVENLDAPLKRLREAMVLAGGASEGVDDASLMRFLKGCSLNVDKAAKAFAKHQEWEAVFKPKGFISETEIANELNAKKSYLQGRDKQGRPISVVIARNHFHNKDDFDEFRRFIVYSLDKVLATAPSDGKINAIIDLNGLGFKNLDSKAFIAGFDIYQSHYPERIEKLYMVNAPLIFNGLWKVVSPFINERTRKKILFVDGKRLQETFLSVIDADQLPAEYGGTAELVLLQDAIVSGWPPVNHHQAS